MRLRIRVAGTAVLALVAIASPACGSKNAGWSAGEAADGSASDDGPSQDDASNNDAPASDCGAVAPHGTLLVASPSVAIDGVTSDGYAIYTDAAAMTLNAVPIAGGAPVEIGTVDATNSVFIAGKVVYFEPSVAVTAGLGTASLSVWTASAGATSLSNSVLAIPASAIASGNGLADVSLDGSRILFIESQDGITGTLMVATTDGRTILPLSGGLDLTTTTGCRPFAVFAGSSVVGAYCTAATGGDAGASPEAGMSALPDAGSSPGAGGPPGGVVVPDAGEPSSGGLPDAGSSGGFGPPDAGVSFDASTSPDARAPFDAAPPDAGRGSGDAGRVAVADAAADATIADSGRGRGGETEAGVGRFGLSGANVATLAAFTGATFAQQVLANDVQAPFAADRTGSHVLVSGQSGLALYALPSGAGTPLDATGAAGRFTKDGANVVYSTSAMALKRSPVAMPAPTTLVSGGIGRLLGLSPDERWALTYQSTSANGQTFDLSVASAVAPGAPARLSVGTNAALYGDAFTADSSYVLYFDNVDGATGLGDFYLARSATGAPTKAASFAWIAVATAGTKVLVSDNCATCSNARTGLADIEALDATHPADVTTIVTQAFANFYLSPARDKVVYSWTCRPEDPKAGIYALPVP